MPGCCSPEFRVYPLSWAADGTMLVLRRSDNNADEDLYLLDTESESPELEAIVAGDFNEDAGRLSPNGEWLAYASNDSGSPQVFLRRAVPGSGRTAVSTGSGDQPLWSPSGQTIYYLGLSEQTSGGGRVMWAADVEFDGQNARVTGHKELFSVAGYANLIGYGSAPYDVDPVTGRFLMARRGGAVDPIRREVTKGESSQSID